MSSGLVLACIVLAVLMGSLYFLIQAEGGFEEIPRLIERVGIMLGLVDPVQQPGIGGAYDVFSTD